MSISRIGMTLVEVIIALSIFLTVTVAVLEGFTSTQNYAALGEAQDDLEVEALRVLDEISLDLTASGWHLPVNPGTTSPLLLDAPLVNGASFNTPADDREVLYYPFVQLQSTVAGMDSGLGKLFEHTWRTPAMAGPLIPRDIEQFLPGAPADRTTLFGLDERSAYERSFFARSQELIFLKATVADWNHQTDRPSLNPTGKPVLGFPGSRDDWIAPNVDPSDAAAVTAEDTKRRRLQVLYPCGWSPVYSGGEITGYEARPAYTVAGVPLGSSTADNVPYGVVMESGYCANDDDQADIDVNWRTIDGGGFTRDQQKYDNLQEYMYAVIPSNVGLGCLVRAHTVDIATLPAGVVPISQDTTRGMVVERVLSDNVVRIVCDTWRTVDQEIPIPDPYLVKSLDINTVRVRLYMARRIGNSNQVLTRVVERVLTMRARNSDKDKDFDQSGSSAAILGRQPIGITF